MQAIQVKTLPCTANKPTRYKAKAFSGSIITSGDGHADPAAYAKDMLCRKLKWDGAERMLRGTLPDGSEVFIFDAPLSQPEPQQKATRTQLTEIDAPLIGAHFASYLANGDTCDLDAFEEAQFDGWLESHGPDTEVYLDSEQEDTEFARCSVTNIFGACVRAKVFKRTLV